MPQVINLEAKDDNALLRAKLSASTDDTLLIVVPKGASTLRDPLSLRLLKRHAEKLGRKLCLITEDEPTHKAAIREGLSVFTSVRQFNGNDTESGPRVAVRDKIPLPRPPRLGKRKVFALALVLTLAAWVGSYLLLPSATITMVLSAKDISGVINGTVTRRSDSLDAAGRKVPGKTMETEVSASTQIATTGKKKVPESAADGELTLANKTDTEITLPKGTKVSTASGVQFATQSDTTVPQGMGSIAKVKIAALQPGESGNVDRLAVNQTVDPQFEYKLSVQNESPTSNGKDKEVKYVTSEDRDKLRNDLLEQAKSKGVSQLVSQKKSTETQFVDTANIEVTSEQFDKQINDESDSLRLSLQTRVTMIAVDNHYLAELASAVLSSGLSDGSQIAPDKVSVSGMEVLRKDADSADVRYQASGNLSQSIDKERVKSAVAGKTRDEIISYLTGNYALAKPPVIKIMPDWLPIAPHFGWRIDVQAD